MKSVKLGLLSLLCLVLFSSIADAQFFQRLRQRQAGCGGSVSVERQRVFPLFRRASVMQTASCSGEMQATTVSCSGSVSYQQQAVFTTSIPETMYAQTFSVESSQTLQPTCVDGKCSLQPQTLMVPTFQPSKKSVPVPTVSDASTFGLSLSYDLTKPTEIPKHVLAQVAEEPVKTSKDSFKSNLVKSIETARKSGKINVRQAMQLRIALISPAFVERAQELAVTQVAFSGFEDPANIPVDENGVVQVEGINWDGLTKFLEALVPLLLMLLKAFGSAS